MTLCNTANRYFNFFFPPILPLLQQANQFQSKEEMRKIQSLKHYLQSKLHHMRWPQLGKHLLTYSRVCSPQTSPWQRGYKDSLKPLPLAPSVCYFGFIPPREGTNNLFLPVSSANHPTFPYLKWRTGRLMRCRSHICSRNTPESLRWVKYL